MLVVAGGIVVMRFKLEVMIANQKHIKLNSRDIFHKYAVLTLLWSTGPLQMYQENKHL